MTALHLNHRALQVATHVGANADKLRVIKTVENGVTLLDFGVNCRGGLEAGVLLARMCLADLGEVSLTPSTGVTGMPTLFVHTDHPVQACLMSQYAGWKVQTDDYFAMGSGPMRAIAKSEALFTELPLHEDANSAVGILEAGKIPTDAAIAAIRAGVGRDKHLILAVAPTASQAGNIQVVARALETAMHKLHEIHFPLASVISGCGSAPLPPVAKNDLEGIGRTNDSILYGATVNLWVDCDDDVVNSLGPSVPSDSSSSHGHTFLSLFTAAKYDFYAMDKALFSPAVITFHNLKTGRSMTFGKLMQDIVRQSFGV